MEAQDLEPRRRPDIADALIKEDLSLFGLVELEARISTLQAEIDRCRATIASKKDSLNTAEAVFKSEAWAGNSKLKS